MVFALEDPIVTTTVTKPLSFRATTGFGHLTHLSKDKLLILPPI